MVDNYVDGYKSPMNRDYYLEDKYFLPTLETPYHFNAPEYAASESESTNIPASEIGTTTNPFAPVLQAFQEKLRMGARRLEIGFFGQGKGSGNNYTPESFGKDERRAIKELAKINEIKVSTHATVAVQGLAGLTRDGTFRDEERERALREIAKAIDFAAEATTGGAIVVHTGEFERPVERIKDKVKGQEVEFQSWLSQGKQNTFYFVDKKKGKLIAVSRDTELQIPSAPNGEEDELAKKLNKKVVKFGELIEWYKKEHEEEAKGKHDEEIALEVLKKYYWKKEKEAKEFEAQKYQLELEKAQKEREIIERIDKEIVSHNYNKLKNELPNVLREAIQSSQTLSDDEKRRLQHMLESSLNSLGLKRLLFKASLHSSGRPEHVRENIKNGILRELESTLRLLDQQKALEVLTNLSLQLDKIIDAPEKPIEIDPISRYHLDLSSQGIMNEEDYDYFKIKYTESKEKEIKNLKKAVEVASTEVAAIEEQMNNISDVESFALEKSAETLARAGLMAYEKYKQHKDELDEPLFIAPENVFAEQYGSHPDELIKLVEKSRQVLKEFLVKHKKFDPKEAEKIAKTHIKATIDIGHLNMWRQYFNPKNAKSPEEAEKLFIEWVKEKTEEMVKKGIIGHVHLSDNLGFGDEHLSLGQGNAPIREFMKIIEKAGIKSIIVEPSGLNPHRVMTDAWSYLNAPLGDTVRRIRFAELQHAHYGLARPPLNIVGSYVPSNSWQLWSKTPLE